jgi:hypothetical protein
MTDMEAIYAWTATEPNGTEGVILALIPILGFKGNLQHRDRSIVETHFRAIAEGHAKTTGDKVRLVKFVRSETLETL